MRRARNGGSARARLVAAGAVAAALIVLVALLAREPRESAREVARESARPSGPAGTLEAGVVELPTAERQPALDTAGRGEPDADLLTVRGYVLDEAGAPIAGAAVDATPERPTTTERTASTTLADGSFELHVEDASCTYRLHALADGYFPASIDALVPGPTPTTVRLRAAPSLTGRVLTTAGARVAGARVRLLAHTSFGDRLEVETRSDAFGAYRLSGGLLDLLLLESPLLEASATGFAPTRIGLRDFAFLLTRAPTLPGLERDVVLSPGNRLEGQVLDETGAPIADAELVVFTHAGRGILTDPFGTTRSSGLGPTEIAATRSGPDGKFVLEGLPVRTGDGAGGERALGDDDSMGSVRVRAAGFAPGGEPLPWTKESEPLPALKFVLAHRASFAGRVVDGAGQPLEDVQVGIQVIGFPHKTILPNGMLPDGFGELMYWGHASDGAKGYVWVRTSADGRFCSPALPCAQSGAVECRIILSRRGEHSEWRELELHAGEDRDLGDVTFAQRWIRVPIEGVVVDRDGTSIAGAEVRLQDQGAQRTGRNGRFRFEHGVEPEQAFPSLDLEVRARGYAAHRQVLSAPPGSPLEIRLDAGRELRGTLSFDDGTPAQGRIGFERPPQPGRGTVFSDMLGATTSDAAGRFAFTELPAPPWVLEFGVDRNGVALAGERTVLGPRTDLALVLPGHLPEFASLVLGVNDSGARPIESIHPPRLVRGSIQVESIRRNARAFVFPEVAPGRYELQVNAPGLATHVQELELEPGEHARVQVALEPGARVRVRVAPPPAGVVLLDIVAESADGKLQYSAVDTDGVADLGVLGQGRWTIGLETRGRARARRAWLGSTRQFEVGVGDSSLEWTIERPELGRVRLELPVQEAGDPPLPPHFADSPFSGIDWSDRHQVWSDAYRRCFERAQELTIELQDGAGVVHWSAAPDDVELDAKRNRVLGVLTAPAGRYTLVVRRGTELLRRSPVQVLPDVTTELDP